MSAAEIGLELAQGLCGAAELAGMGVALVLDERELADPRIGLAQLDAELFGQPHQLLARPVHQLGVGREGDVLRLHGGVDDGAGEIGRLDRSAPRRRRQARLEQRLQPFGAHAIAPMGHRGAIERQPVPEELLAAEVLVIRVFQPNLAHHLVAEVVGVLEDGEPRHQPRRQRRPAGAVLVDGAERRLQEAPVDRPRQPHQRVLRVDDLIEPRAKQILLAALPPFPWPHRNLRPSRPRQRITARDSRESPTRICRKTAATPRNSGKSARRNSRDYLCPSVASGYFTEDKGFAASHGLHRPSQNR